MLASVEVFSDSRIDSKKEEKKILKFSVRAHMTREGLEGERATAKYSAKLHTDTTQLTHHFLGEIKDVLYAQTQSLKHIRSRKLLNNLINKCVKNIME